MKIESLFIYPIKSLAGIELQRSKMEIQGLEYDRRWLLLDRKGKFLTQRNDSQMALIKTAITTDHLIVEKENCGSLKIPLTEPTTTLKKVKIWNDETEAYPASPEASEWFSDILGKKCELVRISAQSIRINTLPHRGDKKRVSFADSQPILITNLASLKDLNSRLKTPVEMSRFRANIIVNTGVAYEEDNWRGFTINDLSFKITKACGRCKVITIDQNSGEVSAQNEPFATLAKYRLNNKSVNFGMRAKWLPCGNETNYTLKVGDSVLPEYR